MTSELNPLNAADPFRNATVSASAGTGKTWMLTTRVLRLLLCGARPASILAITFTRKAAGEMRERVSDRLYELASCDDAALPGLLNMIGLEASPEHCQQARQLYWQTLSHIEGIRITTFHSFCQDILRRFPLEADIPAGFELLQQTGLTLDMAWEHINQQALESPSGKLASNLEFLFEDLGTLSTTRKVLYQFVEQRSDWWAYTEAQTEAVEWASEELEKQLDVPDDPWFLIRQLDSSLSLFAEQLNQRKTNKTIGSFLQAIADARLELEDKPEYACQQLTKAFLTQSFKPRKYAHTNVLDKELGAAATDHIALYDDICATLLRTREGLLRQHALKLNKAWYTVGEQLTQAYQLIKENQRQLDFTDLEWCTYQLLHHADNAQWVQYKLDQRIDHLLFDEFQDTNPTQWQLIRPLLEELASGDQERHRSVFLVGDIKQSIYSFRRANPELQVQASHWLQQRLDAEDFPLNLSRRSSQTVIDTVNQVFALPRIQQHMPAFGEHGTFQKSLWGRLEVHPLAVSSAPEKTDKEQPAELRNPLFTPLLDTQRDHHFKEGQLIARRIQALIQQGLCIDHDGQSRALSYDDIYILLKSRSHVADYERALREAGIPYMGTEKGTFLDNMEIQDMEALLNFLNMPFDNHRLAVILRSPLFHISSEDLITLAQGNASSSWWERLCEAANDTPNLEQHDLFSLSEHHQRPDLSPALVTAQQQLAHWLEQASQLPVHDLIDLIYHQGQVLEKYLGAVRDEERERTQANLIRFIEMALDMDSGRYPSLTRFLDQLKRLRNKENATDKPDNADVADVSARVRFMTIHASKGLEAAVVFMADCHSPKQDRDARTPLVHWPSDKDRPSHFLLTPRKDDITDHHQVLLDDKARRDQQEDANLLYVALTRAKHMLVVTGGCKEEDLEKERPELWYNIIQEAVAPIAREQDGLLSLENGEMEYQPPQATSTAPETVHINNQFSWQRPPLPRGPIEIAPSQLGDEHIGGSQDPDAMERGVYIHALLENWSSPRATDATPACSLPLATREACHQEVRKLLQRDELRFVFDNNHYQQALKEVGMTYPNEQGQSVYGIIDRLVITEDTAWIIDFKSHQHATTENSQAIAESYQAQLAAYGYGVAQLYPEHQVRAGIIFTHPGIWSEVSL